MGYSDANYQTRVLVPARFGATATLTGTASGHVVTVNTGIELPKFTRRTKINKVRVKIITAPLAATVKLNLFNGTNTFATATITGTAGQSQDMVVVDTLSIVAADVQPTAQVVGTATASATQVAGVYDIYFEQQEQFQ